MGRSGFEIKEQGGSSYVELSKKIGNLEVLVSYQARRPPRLDEEEDGNDNNYQEEEELDEIEKRQAPEENSFFEEKKNPSADSCFFDVYLADVNKNKGLWFKCVSMNHDLNIVCMRPVDDIQKHKESQRQGADSTEYSGPEFATLNERLQTSVLELLDSYGVNGELGGFVQLASFDKEMRSYIHWLKDMNNFFASL